MIRIKLGIPATGKTTGSMAESAREVKSGARVLWLTPLKTEIRELVEKFVKNYGVPPDKIYPIPSKLDVCPVLRRMEKFYHVILGIAMCLSCNHKTCVFKSFIQRAVNRSNEGLFIATHRFLWLSLFFSKVYIDEFDFLIPDMFELIPAKRAYMLLKAIEKVFGSKVVAQIRKRYLVQINDNTFLFKSIYPIRYFYNHRELVGISATLTTDDVMAKLLGFDTFQDLVDAKEEGTINYSVYTLPTPNKPDFFYIFKHRNYWTSPYTKKWYVQLINRAKEDTAKGYTATIVARSRREAQILHHLLKRNGLNPLTEAINWDLRNYDDWRRHSVRIIVVRGKFHRALNIESDKIYAFYQHLLPKDRDRMIEKLRMVWGDDAEEIVRFDEYRAHVQTVFRCARQWTNRHEFYLLDSKYDDAFRYFEHIYDFIHRRTKYIESLQ
ncbi:hypothetical protein Igag_1973 [Ignisphaera aggregans DSM 17230]|uniref:Uncharacterized protein n=1 Tax=Ignisphaera aggregans (strain DSM 17230 / JCM 13409 / AQ1.S1) TaxID=583356 RepID=E0STH9_IGNAA|nr:hypothetical protein Igag_1973 [Ignisphaera aggregans DSM 17230]